MAEPKFDELVTTAHGYLTARQEQLEETFGLAVKWAPGAAA